MSSLGYFSPGSTVDFEFRITHGGSWMKPIAGLPPHLQVLNNRGDPSISLRRQFSKGRVSKKKRGR